MATEATPPPELSRQDALYREAADAYGPALTRLARAYEVNPERCRDLLQEIQVALWRSLSGFDERCSLRTWVYRVAHNVAASYVARARKSRVMKFVTLSELEVQPSAHDTEATADCRKTLERLLELIQSLGPIDRQVILLYLEDLDAAAIGEITGLSASNVATKIHRIKRALARRFHTGECHEQRI